MVQIFGFDETQKRISTQQLLQKISAALEAGETEFEVLSSGHHDIGGPLWTGDGRPLKFRVKNPGQRVGSFGLDGTEIIVEGSAPADAGWLNAGGSLTILGDGGDTTAHCAASGKIYVAGRVGTRSGSLMKHDPAYDAPQFWILKNTGSFSFEFMGGGLSAAWQLRLMGHEVTVFEADAEVGGKLRQVIPSERLPATVLQGEIERIKSLGVEIRTGTRVDAPLFERLRREHQAVVIASGAHNPVVIPFPGHERLVKGLDFLKAINAGRRPKIGERVVVIGAGNAGMDVCLGAYAMGAKQVTAVDIQRPAAYQKEIEHFKALGGEILWPAFTEKVDERGLHTKSGRLIEAETVIIAIGERPDLSYVPRPWLTDKGMMEVDGAWQVVKAPGVFALGDAIQPGLLTHAIGAGREVAESVDIFLAGGTPVAKKKPEMIPQSCLSKELFRPQNRGRLCVTDGQGETGRCLSCGTCRDCSMCLEACPEGAIRRVELAGGNYEYVSDDHLCIGCGICAGICPCGIWAMELTAG